MFVAVKKKIYLKAKRKIFCVRVNRLSHDFISFRKQKKKEEKYVRRFITAD